MAKRGFTLIELLIVCLVVLGIAAIIVPACFSACRQAKKVTCLSNLRQLGMALEMYQQDNGQYSRQGWVDTSNSLGDADPGDPLEPYTHRGNLYHCPEASHLLYNWRGALELDLEGDYRPFVLEPASVLAYCPHQTEYFLVLREDRSVTRIPAGRVAYWTYRGGRWLPPGTPPRGDGYEATVAVFPDEPWPLPFAKS